MRLLLVLLFSLFLLSSCQQAPEGSSESDGVAVENTSYGDTPIITSIETNTGSGEDESGWETSAIDEILEEFNGVNGGGTIDSGRYEVETSGTYTEFNRVEIFFLDYVGQIQINEIEVILSDGSRKTFDDQPEFSDYNMETYYQVPRDGRVITFHSNAKIKIKTIRFKTTPVSEVTSAIYDLIFKFSNTRGAERYYRLERNMIDPYGPFWVNGIQLFNIIDPPGVCPDFSEQHNAGDKYCKLVVAGVRRSCSFSADSNTCLASLNAADICDTAAGFIQHANQLVEVKFNETQIFSQSCSLPLYNPQSLEIAP
jgi:hypothetical protein